MKMIRFFLAGMVLTISATGLTAQQPAVEIKSWDETSPGTKITRFKVTTNTATARARVLITQADLAFDTTTGVLILPSTTYATAGCIRYDSTNNTLKYYDGSTWQTVSTGAAGGSAPVGSTYVTIGNDATLTAERALAVTAPLTLSDGGANSNVTLGLATTGVTAGTYGSASAVGTFTVDAYGRLTSASNTSIAIDTSQITSGILPIARGGTNTNATPTAGGIAYGTGTAYAFSAAGTAGQALVSGGAGAPTWFSPTAGSVIFAGSGGVLTQNNAQLFWDNTNNRLGIGTTAPAYKLDVIGSLRATGPAVLGPDTAATGTLRFMELSANGTNFVSFKAPDAIGANVVWTLPSSTGSAGQVLSVGANGVLSWITITGAYIADGTIGTVDIADGAITSAKIADGTIGTVDIANNAVTSAKILDGTIALADLAFTPITGSGTATQIAFYTGANTIGSDSSLYWDNTNKRLGIGTTTPGQRLSVAGTLGILEGGASPTYYTIFQGGDQAANIVYTLPAAQGGAGTVLTNDGTGVLSWSAPSGVPSGYSILGDTPTPPPGYTYAGYLVNTTTPIGGTWATKAAMPTARYDLVAVAVNNKIYAIGGYVGSAIATNEEYDPATNTWATKAAMPTARLAPAAAVVNNKIYVIGGSSGGYLTTNEEYDPTTNTWATKAPMPTARNRLAAAAVNNKIYVIGGYNGGAPLATNEEYDPATNTWATKAPMPTGRYMLAAAAVNNKVYAIGGWDGLGTYYTTNEEYNPATNTWATKAPMPTGRGFLAAVVVNYKIYAIGGRNPNELATNEEYDPTIDAWAAKTAMPTTRDSLAAAVANYKIYAIGGSFNDAPLATNEEYTPPKYFYVHRKN